MQSHAPRQLRVWLIFNVRQKMTADLEAAGHFLKLIEESVTRMDQWAYSLALRFKAYRRAHGVARMLPGGHFSVSCGFEVDRKTERSLLFAVSIDREEQQWCLVVSAEEEDAERSYFHWTSPPIAASGIEMFAQALERAFSILDETLQFPEVLAAFATIQKNA